MRVAFDILSLLVIFGLILRYLTMKTKLAIWTVLIAGILFFFLYSFKKDDTKTVVKPIFNPNLTYGTVSDDDGNAYKTIQIGTQIWMAENLKTTKYRNGEPISNVPDGTVWSALTTGAYCWHDNDNIANKAAYGALYNWYAVADSRNIAPLGWHVPTDDEWTTLTTYLGGESVACDKLKEAGNSHWDSDTGATNSSGFAALPGSFRYANSKFDIVGYNGYWWSSTAFDASNAWLRYLYWHDADVYRINYNEHSGLSVRCVKD